MQGEKANMGETPLGHSKAPQCIRTESCLLLNRPASPRHPSALWAIPLVSRATEWATAGVGQRRLHDATITSDALSGPDPQVGRWALVLQ